MNIPLPNEDKPFLSENGFDVAAYIGKGAFRYVYNGICDERAAKLYPMNGDEVRTNPKILWVREGIPHKEVKLNGKPIAVKTIIPRQITNESFLEGAEFMERLYHPNIVEIYGIFTIDPTKYPAAVAEPKRSYIVMEYLDSGTLREMVIKIRHSIVMGPVDLRFNEMQVKILLQQLTDGLHYLYKKGLCHGDVHTGNVVFTKNPNNELIAKYVDFGLGRAMIGPNDTMSDIIRLGTIFMRLNDDQITVLDSLFQNCGHIIRRMREQNYTDMDVLATDLQAFYSSN